MEPIQALRTEFGNSFFKVFKTITVDSSREFSDSTKLDTWRTGVFFAPPYSLWEHPK